MSGNSGACPKERIDPAIPIGVQSTPDDIYEEVTVEPCDEDLGVLDEETAPTHEEQYGYAAHRSEAEKASTNVTNEPFDISGMGGPALDAEEASQLEDWFNRRAAEAAQNGTLREIHDWGVGYEVVEKSPVPRVPTPSPSDVFNARHQIIKDGKRTGGHRAVETPIGFIFSELSDERGIKVNVRSAQIGQPADKGRYRAEPQPRTPTPRPCRRNTPTLHPHSTDQTEPTPLHIVPFLLSVDAQASYGNYPFSFNVQLTVDDTVSKFDQMKEERTEKWKDRPLEVAISLSLDNQRGFVSAKIDIVDLLLRTERQKVGGVISDSGAFIIAALTYAAEPRDLQREWAINPQRFKGDIQVLGHHYANRMKLAKQGMIPGPYYILINPSEYSKNPLIEMHLGCETLPTGHMKILDTKFYSGRVIQFMDMQERIAGFELYSTKAIKESKYRHTVQIGKRAVDISSPATPPPSRYIRK